jgi:hypothetical protein
LEVSEVISEMDRHISGLQFYKRISNSYKRIVEHSDI